MPEHSAEHKVTVVASAYDEMLDAIDAHPGQALVLESPKGAAGYLGGMVWAELERQVRLARPEANLSFLLDCDDAPGHALNALRHGVSALRLKARDDVFQRVAAIALTKGAQCLRGDD